MTMRDSVPQPVSADAIGGRQLRYLDLVTVAFVVVLLLSNVIGAEKRSVVNLPGIGPWPFGAGILFFPVRMSGCSGRGGGSSAPR